MLLTHEYSLSLNDWLDKGYAGTVQRFSLAEFHSDKPLAVI